MTVSAADLVILDPLDLELLFESNPEQFSGFRDMPYFLVTKVRPIGQYRQLYRVYAMVPFQIDPASSLARRLQTSHSCSTSYTR